VIPVARLQGEAFVLVVPASSPIQNLSDFVREMRANPRGMAVGAGAAGGVDHMMFGLLGQALGFPGNGLSYVAFNSGGPAATAILGSQVRAGISNYGEWQGHIEAGRMRALAISSEERVPGIDVPTFREGSVDVVFYNWRAVFAPPGVPEDHVAQLEALVDAMARSPAWQREGETRGWQPLYQPRREFTTWLQGETHQVEGVLKELGLAS
jgi:putative tricarboxylic transport membrane protein